MAESTELKPKWELKCPNCGWATNRYEVIYLKGEPIPYTPSEAYHFCDEEFKTYTKLNIRALNCEESL